MEVSGDTDRSGFSGTQVANLTGKNMRENEKKKVKTVSIETSEEICHKKEVRNGELGLSCQGGSFCFSMGDTKAS